MPVCSKKGIKLVDLSPTGLLRKKGAGYGIFGNGVALESCIPFLWYTCAAGHENVGKLSE